MRDENNQVIPPYQFIPAAERYDIMPAIDKWVLGHAFEWACRAENRQALLSINLSGSSLGDQSVLQHIESYLEQKPELLGRVCLEITETTAIANLGEALNFMKRLKQRNVRFSLDDFGSGLSSFNYLKTLPVDYIKIDGSFIQDLLDDPVDAAMVESISHVSREMGIQTVAEFVESEALLQRVREMGIDFAQGYAVDKPQPLNQAIPKAPDKVESAHARP
jgi:EAL domain-containing protein (putative c-di-GMP-specific phosphodiesterase class I)